MTGKLQLGIAALAAGMALASAANPPVTTPCGVRLSPEIVYVNKEEPDKAPADAKQKWEASELTFGAGNGTLRINAENPGATDEVVRISLPLTYRKRSPLTSSRGTMRINTAFVLKAGERKPLDIRVPLAGTLYFADRWHPQEPLRIEDSAGVMECEEPSLVNAGYDGIYRSPLMHGRNAMVAGDNSATVDYHCIAATENSGVDTLLMALKPRGVCARAEKPDFARFSRWQDFSVYNALAVSEQDWPGLPEAFTAFLPDWVAAGGILLAIGDNAAPALPAGKFGLGSVVRTTAGKMDSAAFCAALAAATAHREIATSPLECDIKASDAVLALRAETPLSLILGILLGFCVLAGPVLVMALSGCKSRLALLWIFPALSVAFTLSVVGVIIFKKGINPKLQQFSHTLIDERAFRAVTVTDNIILAPSPFKSEIRLDAKDSIVQYCNGNGDFCGDSITCTDDEFVFDGSWIPVMWPVAFRTVTVRPLANAGQEPPPPPMPVAGRLQDHYVNTSAERRAAE